MKRFATTLALLALAAFLAACSGTGAAPSGPAASVDPDAVRITSRDLKFSTDKLAGPADEAFQIVYENQEAAPHNVAIYRDSSAAEKILVEEPFSGPKTVVYNVPALAAGSYFFQCDIHKEMKGTLEIT